MSDLAQATPLQQLQLLRELTRTTGVLHEAQIKHLKLWPAGLFPWAKSWEFTWDTQTKQVEYTVCRKLRAKVEHFDEAVEALNRWVHELLGSEWKVVVKSDHQPQAKHGKRKINAGPVARGKRKAAHRS